MKKLKFILLALIIFMALHVTTVFILSDSRIFPCQIKPVLLNMEMLEWQDSVCGANYLYITIGSIQRLTPGATVARIGLILVLPLLITAGVMYRLHLRRKQVGTIVK